MSSKEFPSYSAGKAYFTELELELGCAFTLKRRRGYPRKTEVSTLQEQVSWGQTQGGLVIPHSEVPFIQMGVENWECQKKPHDLKTGSEKKARDGHCPVKVKLVVIIKFPEYDLAGDQSKKRKREAAAQLRRKFSSNTVQQCTVYVSVTGAAAPSPSVSPLHEDSKDDGASLSRDEGEKVKIDGRMRTRKSIHLRSRVVESSQKASSETPTTNSENLVPPSAEAKVMQLCSQKGPVAFREALPTRVMSQCKKIGEGVYGEVFSSTHDGQNVAIKIIPIEGDFPVNDEPQKKFAEILPEIVIATELSNLRLSKTANTCNFCEVLRVSLVQGKYPSHLIRQWDHFHEAKGSENDRPDMFPSTQLYVLFVFADCGRDLASFQFDSIDQARSVLAQVTFALAVAENALKFEHRDLHWGNVLIRSTEEEVVRFRLEGRLVDVPTNGVEANIIDFTLSRLSKDDMTVFSDLSMDDTLFEGQGDPQFDVYRKMKIENENNWETFIPVTNIMWLQYLADKLVNVKQYPDKSSRRGRKAFRLFRQFFSELLNYPSASEMAVGVEELINK